MSSKYIKYPRTFHLPWSDGITNDDKVLKSLEGLEGKEVVVTEKMDAENTSLYNDHIHARSIDTSYHWSRSWVQNLWSQIRFKIPDGVRLCGENMYAVHSIVYTDLPSYFLLFGVWQGNLCLSWDATERYAKDLGLETVPVLWRGTFDEKAIKALYDVDKDYDTMEGYVVRPAKSFTMQQFSEVVGKYVRPNHVQTDEHWMRSGGEMNMVRIRK